MQRARDKLRRLVPEYLSEFKNIVLMILGVNEGDHLDRFCQGLKRHIRFEVLKAGARSMDKAVRMALTVDKDLLYTIRCKIKTKQPQIISYFPNRPPFAVN